MVGRRRSKTAAALFSATFALLLSPIAAPAQDQSPQDQSPQDQSAENESLLDPEAVQAAVAMSERLRKLVAFSVEAELSWEEVLETGEKILSIEQVTADVARPYGLRLERTSPGRERIFFYDGRRAVLWGPIIRYYTAVEFDGTLPDLAVVLAEKHGYEIPLSDLFLWGSDPDDTVSIREAKYIGEARIGDRLCDHYAFREEGVDWQLWIDSGEGGLPCRYAIVDLRDPANPLFQATVLVRPVTEFPDARFSFVAPDDAVEIPFLEAETAK